MNLQELFEMQRVLDDKIEKEKGLEGQDLLDKKILSLQVELGELANEWRGFKFWSENQEPQDYQEIECYVCNGSGAGYGGYCGNCHGGYIGVRNPMLEEYVDCLHFILSIGNDLGFNKFDPYWVRDAGVLSWFEIMFENIVHLNLPGGREYKAHHYQKLISNFLGLGKSLGFTWEQIEQAYYDKNKVNHERQNNGY